MRERVVVMDGAMGTLLQQQGLAEADFRGERFADWPSDVQGNNDLLNLTQPDLIERLHTDYLDAGADLLETNTFNAQRISLADYGMSDLAYEINVAAARLARARLRRRRGARPGPPPLGARRARPDEQDRRRSRPTSTTPAPATSPSTSSSRPTSSRPAAWSTAAPTC